MFPTYLSLKLPAKLRRTPNSATRLHIFGLLRMRPNGRGNRLPKGLRTAVDSRGGSQRAARAATPRETCAHVCDSRNARGWIPASCRTLHLCGSFGFDLDGIELVERSPQRAKSLSLTRNSVVFAWRVRLEQARHLIRREDRRSVEQNTWQPMLTRAPKARTAVDSVTNGTRCRHQRRGGDNPFGSKLQRSRG